MKLFIESFIFIGMLLSILFVILIPSYIIKVGLDLIFGTDVNLLGVFFLLLSLIMIKTFFFDKE